MNPKVNEDGRYEVVRALKDGQERRLPDHIRRAVLRRDKVRCVWCGSNGRLEIDHIIPWSAGGSDDMDNLRTLCHDCNQKRSNFAGEGDLEPPRFPTAHECIRCNRNLVGENDLATVYCVTCNKLAPGVPSSPHWHPDFSKSRGTCTIDQEQVQEVEPLLHDESAEALKRLADKHRAAALAAIRRVLVGEDGFTLHDLIEQPNFNPATQNNRGDWSLRDVSQGDVFKADDGKPACVEHGAMNAVMADRSLWRCLMCGRAAYATYVEPVAHA